MIQIFEFSCSSNVSYHGFTNEITGSRLPTNGVCTGKWTLTKTIDVNPKNEKNSSWLKEVLAEIEKNGFYIRKTKMEFTEK